MSSVSDKSGSESNDSRLAILLLVYLLVVGAGASVGLIANFPTVTDGVICFPHGEEGAFKFFRIGTSLPSEQGLILLAILAGIVGSFLSAAQSLSSYVGNGTFVSSWTIWYVLRPWIGGILGLSIYFAFRAGLVAGASAVNPHGVVALGILGGWFSKTTTDKLKEVFETMFKTDADKERGDKLKPGKGKDESEPGKSVPDKPKS
jgi:hypothetical protein